MTTIQKALRAGARINEKCIGGLRNPRFHIQAAFIGRRGLITVVDRNYSQARKRLASQIKRQTPAAVLRAAAQGVCVAALAVVLLGCASTVRPVIPTATAPSFDGTNQNSGFVSLSGGRGLITAHARDRYNGLIDLYGKGFIPPLVHDAGITVTSSNLFTIDGEGIVHFATMNRWRREGKPSIR